MLACQLHDKTAVVTKYWWLQSSLYRRGNSGDGLPTAALSNGVVEGISGESSQVSAVADTGGGVAAVPAPAAVFNVAFTPCSLPMGPTGARSTPVADVSLLEACAPIDCLLDVQKCAHY